MPKSNVEYKGLILAAGYGSRLAGVSPITSFKPLTPVNGTPLIFRTIKSLELAGCKEIVIVLGYGHNEIKKAILGIYKGATPLTFVFNKEYQLSNGVSVLAAAEYLDCRFIMTMADHILGDSLMELASKWVLEDGTAALLVDYKLDSIFDMDDATKVWSENGKIVSIGKQITKYNCVDTGLFVCSTGLIEKLQTHYANHGDTSISDGVQDLAKANKMYTIDIGDGFWQDVDTPEMLAEAEKMLDN
jgi:choline kinase